MQRLQMWLLIAFHFAISTNGATLVADQLIPDATDVQLQQNLAPNRVVHTTETEEQVITDGTKLNNGLVSNLETVPLTDADSVYLNGMGNQRHFQHLQQLDQPIQETIATKLVKRYLEQQLKNAKQTQIDNKKLKTKRDIHSDNDEVKNQDETKDFNDSLRPPSEDKQENDFLEKNPNVIDNPLKSDYDHNNEKQADEESSDNLLSDAVNDNFDANDINNELENSQFNPKFSSDQYKEYEVKLVEELLGGTGGLVDGLVGFVSGLVGTLVGGLTFVLGLPFGVGK